MAALFPNESIWTPEGEETLLFHIILESFGTIKANALGDSSPCPVWIYLSGTHVGTKFRGSSQQRSIPELHSPEVCFFFGLSLMQLFRKGAEVEETGRAGVCTEPAAAAGPDRWMQQTPQASSGESDPPDAQRTPFLPSLTFASWQERRQASTSGGI